MKISVLDEHEFNKRNDIPKLSRRSFEVPLLKTSIYNDVDISTFDKTYCIKNYVKNIFSIYSKSPIGIYLVEDKDLKLCLLHDANLQLNKALYNWSIYKQLVSKGIWHWAYVTLYYSQFYAVNALLNIQGNAYTNPLLFDISKNKYSKVSFHIYTKDFQTSKFIFEEKRNYNSHEDPWNTYYNVYNSYRFKLSQYSELYEFDRSNNLKFLKFRHYINYDNSSLFDQFIEYNYTQNEIEEFASRMKLDIFDIGEKDNFQEIEYFASMRIKLLFDITYEILSSSKFSQFKNDISLQRKNMFNNIKDVTPVKKRFMEWLDSQSSAA
jgi:hypothetical protein